MNFDELTNSFDDKFEFFEYPTCKYCGGDIMTLDDTITYHQECWDDDIKMMSLFVNHYGTLQEWYALKSNPDAMINWLESLL